MITAPELEALKALHAETLAAFALAAAEEREPAGRIGDTTGGDSDESSHVDEGDDTSGARTILKTDVRATAGSAAGVFDVLGAATQLPAPGDTCHTKEVEPPAPSLVCVGIDDMQLMRLMHEQVFLQLGADASVSVGETKDEQLAFVDLALGVLDMQLKPAAGAWRQVPCTSPSCHFV